MTTPANWETNQTFPRNGLSVKSPFVNTNQPLFSSRPPVVDLLADSIFVDLKEGLPCILILYKVSGC